MKKSIMCLIVMLMTTTVPVYLYSQKFPGSVNQITSSDLESYITFLASPLLKGRLNGDEGLEIAAQYIASQAKLTGLKPANGNSYFQPYNVLKKSMDPDKTSIQVISDSKDTVIIRDPMFQLIPTGPSDLILDGEVVFAGYGIKADKYKYNDFENLKTEGKILLVMNRAPMSADGKKSKFEEPAWSSGMGFQIKLTTLLYSKAKAILIVTDPKSGFRSFEEANPGIAGYIKSAITLKSDKEEKTNPFMAAMPKLIFINRSVADALLKGSGYSLEELQNSIDSTLQPHSFIIPDKLLKITEVSVSEDKVLKNVAGYLEGSDPVLKNEVVIFSGHYDHIGASGIKVNTGADDDASGCAALLSMAKAFQSLGKKPLRSVLFLWVSGEEIGLFGSKSYVNNPLFPLDKTVADLNMDMIGRDKELADSTSETPMTGPNSVFVIADNQSKDLIKIADEIDSKTPLNFDYSLSGRNHPLQLFSRSDHYNFAQKNIPVLCFTTGIHSDYHTPGDVIEKIDFKKMETITRTMYKIGYAVANRKTRLVVDNPFNSWGKSK
ncbi:MAG: M28 family peptidase [Bacteroidetes bacterium]|nr:MAG: M28 family peptidase [Bacteroidota bacterium]